MNALVEFVSEIPLFYAFLTVAIYVLSGWLQRKTGWVIFNPLLFTTLILIILLTVLDVPYETYSEGGGQYISIFVSLATVSLGVLLKKNFGYLKRNAAAILTGVTMGVLVNAILVVGLGVLMGLDQEMLATLLPKSVTAAIAQPLSESIGGIPSLTVGVVVLTGILGNAFGVSFLKAINIYNPIAQGAALGGTSHAMGTAAAVKEGELQGGIGATAIVLSGLITSLVAPLALQLASSLFF